MPNNYTTDELLTSLKRRGLIPSTSETLTTTDFIDIANEELQTYIVPAVLSVRQEFYVFNKDTTITASQSSYPISYRAIGGKLREVLLSDTNGQNFVQLEQIEPEREPSVTTTGMPIGFKIEANNIVLLPTPSIGGMTLRQRILHRPDKLVATTNTGVGRVSAVDSTLFKLTFDVSYNEPTFSTSSRYDLVSGTPNFTTLFSDQIATGWSRVAGPPAVWTLTSATYPTYAAIGDWVSTPDITPVVQAPLEFFPILAERTAAQILKATGFGQQATLSMSTADKMLEAAVNMIQNREESQAPVITNPYGPGWAARRGAWRRF